MLLDRYLHDDIVARVPQMAARIDPILRRLDALLDDNAVYQTVPDEFGQRYPRTRTDLSTLYTRGDLLRMLLLKRLQDWSFQETEDQVDQSLILRWFCRLSWQETPDDTTLIRLLAHSFRPRRSIGWWRAPPSWRGRRRSPGGGSCGWMGHACRRRSLTRPTAVCSSTTC